MLRQKPHHVDALLMRSKVESAQERHGQAKETIRAAMEVKGQPKSVPATVAMVRASLRGPH